MPAFRSIPHAPVRWIVLAVAACLLLLAPSARAAAPTSAAPGEVTAAAASSASAAALPNTAAQGGRQRTSRGKKAVTPRIGGAVKAAWPAKGRRAPGTKLARWLARQVGPVTPRVCSTLPRRQARNCNAAKRAPRASNRTTRRGTEAAAGAAAVRRVAAAQPKLERLKLAEPIQLLRSYAIPADDPSYDRLLNWSWSYDSAVAAAAFASGGDKDQATRLLDQLAALQRKDGSIDIAFNVESGEAADSIRSGTVAWLGLAAATYDDAFGSDRYRDTAIRAVGFLLSLQREDGLIAGGPDVKWVSTQHNLIAYALLGRLSTELEQAGDGDRATAYREAAAKVGESIDKQLLVQQDGAAHFRQGVEDEVQALDTQALGSMYLLGRDQADLGKLVLTGADEAFALGKRSISRSEEPATFNATYEAEGPFSGYRPYLGKGTPDVLWFEGTAEMRLARVAFGQDTSELDDSIKRWSEVTAKQGDAPLGADRTVTDNAYGEYHVWPTGAAAAWSLLSQAAPAFFVAPLPSGTSVVTDWTRVRGDETQIGLTPDGRVDMKLETGERRVLGGSSKARDYSVTVDADLYYGSGYGTIVRGSVDAKERLTGYVVQFERASGAIALRQFQDDEELKAPLAYLDMPSGYDWNARHRTVVTVKGDTLLATIDGETVLDVPDLAAASAKAAEASGASGFSAPTAGRVGLRSWSTAEVRFQQVTVERAG